MDIKKRKPKVINLKKKRKVTFSAIKVHTDDPIAPKISVVGNYHCMRCGASVYQELGRCTACKLEHQQIVQRLDARPKQAMVEKVPPKLTYRKEASKGVIVTISTTEPLRM